MKVAITHTFITPQSNSLTGHNSFSGSTTVQVPV